MRMSKKAMASLSMALTFNAQRHGCVMAGETEKAAMYARWADEALTEAGLPVMAIIDAAFDTKRAALKA